MKTNNINLNLECDCGSKNLRLNKIEEYCNNFRDNEETHFLYIECLKCYKIEIFTLNLI